MLKICSLSIVTFLSLFVLLLDSVRAETSSNNEDEIKKRSNEQNINNISTDRESQTIQLQLNFIKSKPFPVFLRDINNNNSNDFFNSNIGDYGQKIIIEYRFDF